VRILVADDDSVSRLRLQRTLVRLGHEVIAVADGPSAIDALVAPDGPPMAILDWMMPGADGLDVCRAVRQRAPQYVYVILLTARDAHDDMVEAFDSGVDDYLRKPFDASELRARLRSGDRVLALQDRLLRAQDALRVEAMHDPLTGLWNRRMIVEQLGRELHRARHDKHPLAVLVADIDHFKLVNDSHGHATGDAVLRETAQRMRAVVREYDFLGRYGGEEFLFVLPGCNEVTAREAAERVRLHVSDGLVNAGNARLPVTLSLGLSWTGAVGDESGPLINAADEALYRAKAAGRNRVES
jgi:two-component system, cell cycle response regulator